MLTYNVLNEYVERMKKNDLAIVSTTDNIKTLTTNDINKLRAGDIVLKEDSTGKHAYIVSYKKDGTGICMTYSDATYTETISYDYNAVTKEWVYNSMDSTELVSKSYVDSLMSGALKRAIVETLPTEDIDTNTIYMVLDSEASTQGNVYNEYLYINNSWELIGTTATTPVPSIYHHKIILTCTSGCITTTGYSNFAIDIIMEMFTNSATTPSLAVVFQNVKKEFMNGILYKTDFSECHEIVDGKVFQLDLKNNGTIYALINNVPTQLQLSNSIQSSANSTVTSLGYDTLIE